MIVALTAFSGDAAAALRLLEWISDLGGVSYHTLVLGTTPQVNPHPLLEAARKAWGGVEHFTIHTQNETAGWPVGPNQNFAAVCEHMKVRNQPFFFMESDCVPVCGNWLDQIEREYLTSGKPFMGVVHSMVNPATGETIPDTLHMNGAGVYPSNLHSYLPTLPFVTGAIANQPWDVALRWEMLYVVDGNGGFKVAGNGQRVSGCHATEKICFCWRTVNYRVENDQLVYDKIGPAHTRSLDFSKHVLHHGCKDGSLISVLRNRVFPPTAPPVSTAAPAVVQSKADDAPPSDAPPAKPNVRLAAALKRTTPPPPRKVAKKRKPPGRKTKVATPAAAVTSN